LQNLIAYLSRLTGIQAGIPTSTHSSDKGGIEFSRILNPAPGDWLTYNGKVSGNRYSELTQINATNLSRLGVKWTFSIPLWSQFLPDTPYFRENMQYFGLEVVPIVADGIMYVTGPNQAFALDARTGHQIWHYARLRTPGLFSDPSLGTNRGVAILGDKVFMVTDNAHLIALNRITGRLVWEAAMPMRRTRCDHFALIVRCGDAGVSGVISIQESLAAYRPRVANAWAEDLFLQSRGTGL
jgi:glucose dehydrogenase